MTNCAVNRWQTKSILWIYQGFCPLPGAISYSFAHFGQGSGPIFMDDVECSGYELRLIDCIHDNITTEDRHFEDAGVLCQLC